MQVDQRDVERVARFVAEHAPLFVITGAGCSTESGIFDYRDDDGNWKRKPPVQLSDFLTKEPMRRRYWARSMLGWPSFERARPNPGHTSLARLEASGHIATLVTQNVDGLHGEAGHRNVIDLHGTLASATCVDCRASVSRTSLQRWLETHNPAFTGVLAEYAPDGDADLEKVDLTGFHVPRCLQCGGVLKPDVVFFGDSVPKERVAKARSALAESTGVLIVGSSVSQYSSFRFCREAHRDGIPLAAVNRGVTRADDLLDTKATGSVGAVMTSVCAAVLTNGPARRLA